MHRRLLSLFFAIFLTGCAGDNLTPARSQLVAADAGGTLDAALDRFFRDIDQVSASVDSIVKEPIAPATRSVLAPELAAARVRIKNRLAAVDALKVRQVAGENHRGYLEQRGTLQPPEERTVSDENSDRRAVYAAVAAQQKVEVERAGRQRAQKIALNSARGVLLQGGDGIWYEKP